MGTAVIDDAAAKAAADKATADAATKAAADKATADAATKAATDKATADAKALADKAAADTAAATAAAEKARAERTTAIKGVLKLPDKSTIDPAITERTAAIASELGLTPEHAQKMFGLLVQEAATHGEKAVAAAIDAHKPGGKGWETQQAENKAAALADPMIGGGKPDQLAANLTLAKRVLARFGGTPDQVTALEQSGLATNPSALRLLVAVGKAMKEDQFVAAPPKTGDSQADKLDRLYPSMKKKD